MSIHLSTQILENRDPFRICNQLCRFLNLFSGDPTDVREPGNVDLLQCLEQHFMAGDVFIQKILVIHVLLDNGCRNSSE